MRMIIRDAPAKINLGLDIVGKRADGYHLLETVFQTVSIFDTVTVTLTNSPGIVLECDDADVPCDASNIAWKAAKRYMEATRMAEGVAIQIQKRIPMQAGMGGGSTDGAAVLQALQKLTHACMTEEKMLQIALELGADVPFFLYGGTAYASGIGEKLELLPLFIADHIVIAKGKSGVSTAEAYQKVDTMQNPVHPPVLKLRRRLLKGNATAEEIAPLCGNLFESAVVLPEVMQIQQVMQKYGALCNVMTGSGSAVFGLFATKEDAQESCRKLQQEGNFAQLCHTL